MMLTKELLNEEREWREAQAERDRRWRNEDIAKAKSSARRDVWKDIGIAVLGAALLGIAQVIVWIVQGTG